MLACMHTSPDLCVPVPVGKGHVHNLRWVGLGCNLGVQPVFPTDRGLVRLGTRARLGACLLGAGEVADGENVRFGVGVWITGGTYPPPIHTQA